MARLTACFALSAILVLSTGICFGNGQFLPPIPTDPVTGCLQFPGGQLFPSPLTDVLYQFLAHLPPMRIISKGDTSLSVAVDDNGNVVLAKTNCRDARQLWAQHFPIPGANRFSLVNLGNKYHLSAIQIPEDGTYPVKLAPYAYSPWLLSEPVPASMLWTQESPLFGDGFSKIRSYKDQGLVLDGLNGNVQEGTVVGAYPADHGSDHVLWKIEGFLSRACLC